MVQSSCHEKLLFYLETQLLKVSNVWCYFSLQLAVQFRGSSVVSVTRRVLIRVIFSTRCVSMV